jgi:hypothetical protein
LLVIGLGKKKGVCHAPGDTNVHSGSDHGPHSSTSSATELPLETIRQLHDKLGAIGLSVMGEDAGATPRFGASTSVQLKATWSAAETADQRVGLCQLYGFEHRG